MKKLFAGLLLLLPIMAWAESEAAAAADVEAGKALSGVCAACHGAGGNSAIPDWPKLAGQHAEYLEAQLLAFKSGHRNNPLMAPQAAALSDADIANLSAYFAAQPVSTGTATEEAVAAVGDLYRFGDASRGIPACAACHGPDGAGNPTAQYPHLGGQHAKYTAAQLKAYRAGGRSGTPQAQIMVGVAKALTDEEIDALASYLNGLQ